MFGMKMVKVIHEELILLLVLDFDDGSPSRMEIIYRRKKDSMKIYSSARVNLRTRLWSRRPRRKITII